MYIGISVPRYKLQLILIQCHSQTTAQDRYLLEIASKMEHVGESLLLLCIFFSPLSSFFFLLPSSLFLSRAESQWGFRIAKRRCVGYLFPPPSCVCVLTAKRAWRSLSRSLRIRCCSARSARLCSCGMKRQCLLRGWMSSHSEHSVTWDSQSWHKNPGTHYKAKLIAHYYVWLFGNKQHQWNSLCWWNSLCLSASAATKPLDAASSEFCD